MNSMTGYGRGEATVNKRTLVVEIKSVNHRFLDISVKLPRALAFAEDTIKKLIAGKVTRGHFDVFTSYTSPADEGTFSLNEAAAASYLEMSHALAKNFGLKEDYTTSSLLRAPGVVEEVQADASEDELISLVSDATNAALDGLVKMRNREGQGITADLMTKMDNIENMTLSIEARAPFVQTEYASKLKQRISEALLDVEYDEQRLLTEVAVFADKCCIDEEIARLKTHVSHYRSILSSNESAGRKLDFLTQELNREANTIGSKANDADIAAKVVELKCEIEKVREQIQNLE